MARTIIVGTTPVVILLGNPRRTAWSVFMLSTSVASGNTGRVHIGKGFPPTSTLGEPNAGNPIMRQGDSTAEGKGWENDPSPFKGAIWAVASAADQQILVDEDIGV